MILPHLLSKRVNLKPPLIGGFFGNKIMQKKKFMTAQEKKTKDIKQLRGYAYWLLARRDYGTVEMRAKLIGYALHDADADALILELVEMGYISDEKVSQSVLNSQLQCGKGLARIKQEFAKKGLALEHVEGQLGEVDWLRAAYDLKVRRFGEVVETDPKKQAKQVRFLQYRGYPLGDVFKAVKITPDYFND